MKMNKMYEAPVAEMIEMAMPVVLMESIPGVNASDPQGTQSDPTFPNS